MTIITECMKFMEQEGIMYTPHSYISINYSNMIYMKYLARSSKRTLDSYEVKLKSQLKNLYRIITTHKCIELKVKSSIFNHVIDLLLKYNQNYHYNETIL